MLCLQAQIAEEICDQGSSVDTFATLRTFPQATMDKHARRLRLWKTVELSVSWQELAPVHIYRVRVRRKPL